MKKPVARVASLLFAVSVLITVVVFAQTSGCSSQTDDPKVESTRPEPEMDDRQIYLSGSKSMVMDPEQLEPVEASSDDPPVYFDGSKSGRPYIPQTQK